MPVEIAWQGGANSKKGITKVVIAKTVETVNADLVA